MTKETQNTGSFIDYTECLDAVLAFYDIQADIPGLINNHLSDGYLTYNNLKILGQKVGLQVRQNKRSFAQIDSLNRPAILDLGSISCVYIPDANGKGRFVIPDENKDISLQDIAKTYTGTCYILTSKDKSTNLDVSHMQNDRALDWFWNPIVSFWDRYAEILLCALFINVLALAIPLYTLNIYDRVVVNFVEDTLIVLTMGVITAIIFDFIFKTLRTHIVERIAIEISSEYDTKLMERMLNIKDVDFHLTTGEKSNLFRELQGIKDFYSSRMVPTLVDIPFFILFTLVIYMIAPILALVPVIAATLILTINLAAQTLISKYTAQSFTSMQNKSAYLVEMLSGLSTINTLGANGHKLLKWKQVTRSAAKANSHHNTIGATISNLSVLITQIAQVCIIFFGAYLINTGDLTVGGLVACTIIYGRSVAPIVTMASVLSRLKQSNDVLRTIDKIFQLPHEDCTAETTKGQKGPFNGDLDIRDLIYQYPGQSRPALYKINMNIKAGEHVGLLGKTGAGKSTLSQVITGMVTPNEGDIHLDGYAYKAIADTELKRSIGYVPQDAFFFNGSLLDNITMGNKHISAEDLDRAIHMSGLDLVIKQTSEGLDMNVGEGGKRLSGGQKQSVALARAFARNPNILVFDEPTTGMDSALEERIRHTIQEFTKDKTFIMVTHRTTLLPLVSRLVLLDQGRIIADGARDDILRKLSNKA
ncbi:MAG: ATP-binding cassette domain-containing protein [Alphaproteobacteria bacterium]